MKLIVCLVVLAACAEARPGMTIKRNAQEVEQNNQREHELKLKRLHDDVEHQRKLRLLTRERRKRQIGFPTLAPLPFIPGFCSSNPCQNGGICFNNGNSLSCVCPPEYTGSFCETMCHCVQGFPSCGAGEGLDIRYVPNECCPRYECVPADRYQYTTTEPPPYRPRPGYPTPGLFPPYPPQPDLCASYPCPYGGSCYVDMYGYPQCSPGYPGTNRPPPASTCQDETFTVSPSSPQMITHTYSNHDNCTWTVNVAVEYGQNYVVEADIEYTSIERNYDCSFDSLEFFDSNNDRIGKFCGGCTGTLTASGPAMYIRFSSDSSEIGYRPEYTPGASEHVRIRLTARQSNTPVNRTAQIDAIQQPHCTVTRHAYTACDYHWCSNGGSCQVQLGGNFMCLCPSGYTGYSCESLLPEPCGSNTTQEVFPNQPIRLTHDYRDNQDCFWTYRTPSNQPNLVLRVEVMDARIEQDHICGFDYLNMSDPMNPNVATPHLCGSCSEGSFLTGSGQLRVHFHSDSSVVGMNGVGRVELAISAEPNYNAAANQIMSFGPATCTMADPTREPTAWPEGSGDPEGWWSTMMPPSCDAAEVQVTAGQVLPAALYTDTQPDGYYRNNACKRWNIASTEGQCIVVSVGAGGFDTEQQYDYVTFQDQYNQSVTRREGIYSPDDILFTSQTNRVNVNFTSDGSVRQNGFTLNVRSIHCNQRNQYPEAPISSMGSPEPEPWSMGTVQPTPAPVMTVIDIEDHPNGYQLMYPSFSRSYYDNNADIQWDIRMRNNQIGKKLMFTVILFSTESRFDFLHINSTQTELSRLDGYFPENFPVAMVPCNSGAGTCAKVNFRSDGSATGTGFEIVVKLVDAGVDACQPNPCTGGAQCQVRYGGAQLNNGGHTGASHYWYPGRTTPDPAEHSCRVSRAQVCCRCPSYSVSRDCSAPRATQYGGGMTTVIPWYY